MLDEIVERAVPWGFWIALGALAGAAFPRETRVLAKHGLRAGFQAANWARTVGAEAYEKGQDVFAEARSEYDHMVREAQREAERGRIHVVKTREPGPRRRTAGTGPTGRTRRRPAATAQE